MKPKENEAGRRLGPGRLRPLEGTEFRLCEVVGGGALDGELLIHLDDVPAWLDTIDPAELTPEGRAKLERYKSGLVPAVRRHFAERDAGSAPRE